MIKSNSLSDVTIFSATLSKIRASEKPSFVWIYASLFDWSWHQQKDEWHWLVHLLVPLAQKTCVQIPHSCVIFLLGGGGGGVSLENKWNMRGFVGMCASLAMWLFRAWWCGQWQLHCLHRVAFEWPFTGLHQSCFAAAVIRQRLTPSKIATYLTCCPYKVTDTKRKQHDIFDFEGLPQPRMVYSNFKERDIVSESQLSWVYY